PQKLFLAVLVFAVFTVVIYQLSFRLTTERVPPPPKEERHAFGKTIPTLLHNRPFLVVCFASMLLIMVQFYTQTVNNYLFKDYFAQPELYSLVTIANYLPTALLLPFLGKMVLRLGKKRLCAYGLLLAAAANAALLLLRTANPYVFLALTFFSGLGSTFLVMEIWALVTDVIDYQELLSRTREEGTCYALFSFTRKMGQTLAGGASSLILKLIHYDGSLSGVSQAPAVVRSMYTTATLVPAAAFFLMFLALAFLYPLGMKEEEEMRAELRKRRAEG
ncbi:MAG: MFS transporter, partial [Oscillospiraceae bacterium]|nr:MFS transporter [Oscillospiraceae bacterium]